MNILCLVTKFILSYPNYFSSKHLRTDLLFIEQGTMTKAVFITCKRIVASL